MGIITIILGIILMGAGVKKENKNLRNVGIIIVILGCILSSSFIDG